MFKSLFVLSFLIASAISPSVHAADTSIQLNPMILIELNADMKADMVYSERMLTVDIKDDLVLNNKASLINRHFVSVQNTRVVLVLTDTSIFVRNAAQLSAAE